MLGEIEWRPIETAPKSTWVLVYLPWVKLVRQARYNEPPGKGTVGWKVCFGSQSASTVSGTPTHWMPLPEPPNSDGEAQGKHVAALNGPAWHR